MRWPWLAAGVAFALPFDLASAQEPLLRNARQMLADGPAALWDVELSDLDGDGDLDLYTDGHRYPYAPYGAEPRMHLYDDPSGFRELAGAVDTAVGGEDYSDLAFADLDGDGDTDAYRVTRNTGRAQVLLGDGAGKLTFAPGGGVLSRTPWAVALADLDLDGDVDAVADDTTGFSVGLTDGLRIHVNGGGASFATLQVPLPAESAGGGGDIEIGDVDADGLPDVVVTTGTFPRLVLNGPGLAFAHAPGAIPSDGLGHEIELGDLNGDGALDLAFATDDVFSPGDQGLDFLYRGDGLGSFAFAVVLPGGERGTSALELGDLDGDADLDAVVAYGDKPPERTGQTLLRNDGGFSFKVVPDAFESVSRDCGAMALGDVDGDGDADLVLAQTDMACRFLLGDGALGFAEVETALPWSGADGAVLLADLDGDGDLDGWASIAQAQVQRNPGNGLLVPDPAATAGAVPAKKAGGASALAFDCNGDGALDVYQARFAEFVDDQLYVNGGSGAFRVDHISWISDTALAADVNDDGHLDLVLDADDLLLGDGACGFTWDFLSSLTLSSSQVSALADLDLDGDLDLVSGFEAFMSKSPVWYADIGVQFGPEQPLAAPLDARDLALPDLDGDGDADVLFATSTGPVLLRNDGAGVFTDVTASLPVLATDFWLPHLAVLDLEEDGDLDFVMTDGSTGGAAHYFVYANQSGGVFTDGSLLLESDSDSPMDLTAGDIDGDGDVDLVATEAAGRLHVITNHVRQLAWRGLPRVGKDLALDVSGPKGEPWVLAMSHGQASIPLPPFGLLQLDPGGLKVVAGGLLDAFGQAAAFGLMPPGAGSVGLTVYGQAVVGNAPRLTNLEVVTLAAY